jgi:hypothetical protein
LQSHAGAGAAGAQRFCLATSGAAATTGSSTSEEEEALPPQVVLAWTDPPGSTGLIHDLDLEVMCDGDGWALRHGNGAVPDRVNNVEKVVLSTLAVSGSGATSGGGLCVVTVRAASGVPPSAQPFALVASGPFALAPGCEAPLAPPLCVHGTWVALQGCQCEQPWVGPFCDQTPEGLVAASPGAAPMWRTLRPLQPRAFSAVAGSGGGTFELLVEHAEGEQLQLLASTTQGPHLWAFSNASADVPWNASADVRIALNSTMERTMVSVQVPGSAEKEFHFVLLNRGREGPALYTATWCRGHCPEESAATSLRGSHDGGGSGGASEGPSLLAIVLCVSFGLAACCACTAAAAWRLHSSRRWWRHGPESRPEASGEVPTLATAAAPPPIKAWTPPAATPPLHGVPTLALAPAARTRGDDELERPAPPPEAPPALAAFHCCWANASLKRQAAVPATPELPLAETTGFATTAACDSAPCRGGPPAAEAWRSPPLVSSSLPVVGMSPLTTVEAWRPPQSGIVR